MLLHSTLFFFFNDTATTEIYTLSLHDALPISASRSTVTGWRSARADSSARSSESMPLSVLNLASTSASLRAPKRCRLNRSEEHTSELQSRLHLVCRLLLEKKKNTKQQPMTVST